MFTLLSIYDTITILYSCYYNYISITESNNFSLKLATPAFADISGNCFYVFIFLIEILLRREH